MPAKINHLRQQRHTGECPTTSATSATTTDTTSQTNRSTTARFPTARSWTVWSKTIDSRVKVLWQTSIEWVDEFRSEPLPQTKLGEKRAEEIQKRLSSLEGLIPEKTANASKHDCLIAGETIARGIAELAAHDRDFLFIEIVSDNMLRVLMLEMPPGGHPRQKRLSNQHKQRLLERLEAV